MRRQRGRQIEWRTTECLRSEAFPGTDDRHSLRGAERDSLTPSSSLEDDVPFSGWRMAYYAALRLSVPLRVPKLGSALGFIYLGSHIGARKSDPQTFDLDPKTSFHSGHDYLDPKGVT